jgi:Fe-S-cluster containining protein
VLGVQKGWQEHDGRAEKGGGKNATGQGTPRDERNNRVERRIVLSRAPDVMRKLNGAVRCLSMHATYRCRDSGACCTAGWPIPVEADRLAQLDDALASGELRPVGHAAAAAPIQWLPRAPRDTPAVLAVAADACVFHRPAAPRRCEIHHALGHDALPLACRQFPRMSVIDPRGVSVTLSHYCPTAASLLDTSEPVAITTAAPAFPADGEYVGLDVGGDLPPALRPDMLMDWEAWWMWEERCVAALARSTDPAQTLAALAAVVDDVRAWGPTQGALIGRIEGAFARAGRGQSRPAAFDHAARLRESVDAVPEGLRPQIPRIEASTARPSPSVVRNFLAAHVFANWTAHLGEGLRTWLRSIESAFALITLGYDVRGADLLLRHLTDPYQLAKTWNRAERWMSPQRSVRSRARRQAAQWPRR